MRRQKTEIMATILISSWQIKGEKEEVVTDFIFLGSKITVYGDWAIKLKDTFFLEEKLRQT